MIEAIRRYTMTNKIMHFSLIITDRLRVNTKKG